MDYLSPEEQSWRAKDGISRRPALGEMEHTHIYNVMRFALHLQGVQYKATPMWRALHMGLELPSAPSYTGSDNSWRLGHTWEDYTIGMHQAYFSWGRNRRGISG